MPIKRLVSTNALAQSKNYANAADPILRGLMEGLGWHDLQADILVLDAEQKTDEQQLKVSIQNHLQFPTESTRTELLLGYRVKSGFWRYLTSFVYFSIKNMPHSKIKTGFNYLSFTGYSHFTVENR